MASERDAAWHFALIHIGDLIAGADRENIDHEIKGEKWVKKKKPSGERGLIRKLEIVYTNSRPRNECIIMCIMPKEWDC